MRKMRRRAARPGLAGLFVLISGLVHFQGTGQEIVWSAAKPLNSTAISDSGRNDQHPFVATDEEGVWIAVWDAPLVEDGDHEILFSRSTNNGITWSPAAALNTDAGSSASEDTLPFVASGTDGRWVALWIRATANTTAIVMARSTDDGQTWSTPANLSDPVPVEFGFSSSITHPPHAATDKRGVWVAAWSQQGDIFYTRSTNDGVTFDEPQAMITTDRDLPDNASPRIATDGVGNWLLVWSHFGDLNGLFDDRIIAQAFSTDNALNWSEPAALSNPMTTEGATRRDIGPRLDTDGKGRWTVFWSRGDCCGNEESDLFFSQSFDNDFFFSTPFTPHHHFGSDSESDGVGELATDGLGNWMKLFWTREDVDGAVGDDSDIFFIDSTSNGETWNAPAVVNSYADSDSSFHFDSRPHLATNTTGTWIAVWRSNYDPGGEVGSDTDIFVASTAITGNLRGAVRIPGTRDPIACAAVVIEDNEPDLEVRRVVTTRKNGGFFAPNLAPGNYQVTVHSTGHEMVQRAVTISAGLTTSAVFEPQSRTPVNGVQGLVTDGDSGNPAVGVQVVARIGEETIDETYTCGSGRYVLSDLVVEKQEGRTVTLWFEDDAYERATREVTISEGGMAESNPQMTKSLSVVPGAIAGLVTDGKSETPLEGARVTILGLANLSTETNASGVYNFPAVPEGRYRIEASAADFQTEAITSAIPGGETTGLDFSLVPGTDAGPEDVNRDDTVNALDIQLVINAALGIPVNAEGSTDIQGDGQTNALDIQLVINAALGLS